MNQLKQIQTQMLLLGLHQHRANLNTFMVFCTHPSLGDLHYAEKVFNHIRTPGFFIYNVMIKARAKTSSFKSVIKLFRLLRKDKLWPDNFMYPFVFKAIGCLGEAQKGAKVHGLAVKTGLEFDPYVCNSLIDMYAKE